MFPNTAIAWSAAPDPPLLTLFDLAILYNKAIYYSMLTHRFYVAVIFATKGKN
jgi:hypothetical protein